PDTLRFKCYPYNQLSPRPILLRLNFPLLVHHRDVFHTYVASYRPETLRFKCYPYHQLDHGDLVLNCLANGTWNGTEPSCSPIPGRPETLGFKCYPYHQLDHGDLVLNCLANGTWNGTEPSCSPIPG
ncbi:sushi, von Willebrand factor type A, EGF and pentraxin domain-containing protein 1, partial [Elysia marginata]